MEKTTTTQANLRNEARVRIKAKLKAQLDAMIVIDGATKAHILNKFHNTDIRFTKMKFTEKKWNTTLNWDLWEDYKELEAQFKMLDIFSDKFYSILNLAWYELIQSYNPYTTYK